LYQNVGGVSINMLRQSEEPAKFFFT